MVNKLFEDDKMIGTVMNVDTDNKLVDVDTRLGKMIIITLQLKKSFCLK